MKAEDITTQSIEYSRTIVPSTMRSPYWKYFGFPSDNANNILTKQKIICTLCNTAIAYNKNTSNLRTHLISKHTELLHELQQQQTQQQQLVSSPSQPRKRAHMDLEQLKLPDAEDAEDENLKYSFTFKRHAHSLIVEEPDDAVESSQDPVEIATADEIDYGDYATTIQSDDGEIEQQSQKDGEDQQGESSISEIFPFVNMDNLCGKQGSKIINTSEIDLDSAIVNMLITDLLPTSTVEGIGFKSLICHFGTVDKTTVQETISSLYDTMVAKITAHLNSTSQKQAFSLGVELNRNVDKSLVMYIYVNYYCTEENELLSVLYRTTTLTDGENFGIQSLVDGLHLPHCAAVVMNGSNSMVESFFQSHAIPIIPCLESVLRRCMALIFDLPSVTAEFNKVVELAKENNALSNSMPEMYSKCPWSKLSLLQFVHENITYDTYEDTSMLEKSRDLSEYINPLKITLETIAEETLPLCSLMRPFILKLIEEHFSTYFSEDDYLIDVKRILNDELTNRVLKNTFLNEATFFDGRFRRDFLDASHVTTIKQSVCERFKPLTDQLVNTKMQIKQEAEISSANSNKRSGLKSFFQRSTEINHKSVASAQKYSIEHEINKYNCEPSLDLEQCPISWWRDNDYTYRRLVKVSEYYLSVPCCVNNLFRSSITERNELQNKRQMLRNQSAQQIWYLHYNKKFYDKIGQ